MGPFSSESRTSKSTADNRIAASDQAVVINYKAGKKGRVNSPNTRNTVKVGKGGTLQQITNTSIADPTAITDSITGALSPALANLAAQIAGSRDEQDNGLEEAVHSRGETQVEEGGKLAVDTIQTGKPSKVVNWILWALVAFAAVAVIYLFKKGGAK